MSLASVLKRVICAVLVLTFLALASLTSAQTQTPSPALLVLNKDDSTLSIVDPTTLKTVAVIPTGEAPHEIIASDDGKFAFVANYGARTPGNSISMIDLSAQKELRRVDLGALRRPHGITFADGKVWFTAEANKVIARYDPTTDKIDWVLGLGQNGTHMLLFSKDNSLLFTSNIGSDSIGLLQRSSDPSGWSALCIPVGKGPEGGDISPDGREYWAANSGDGTVSVIDVAAKKVTQTLDLHTKHSNRLKFTPDGKLVFVSDLAGNEVIILDAASRKEIKRLNLGKNPEGILVAPDGSRAYVATAGEKAVAVVDLKTLDVSARISTGAGPDGLAWAARR